MVKKTKMKKKENNRKRLKVKIFYDSSTVWK